MKLAKGDLVRVAKAGGTKVMTTSGAFFAVIPFDAPQGAIGIITDPSFRLKSAMPASALPSAREMEIEMVFVTLFVGGKTMKCIGYAEKDFERVSDEKI